MTDRFEYTCETCSDMLVLTREQYNLRVQASRDERWRGQERVLCDDCLAAWRQRRTTTPARDMDGVIVTAREQETGNLWTLQRYGYAREALRDVCATLDEADGDWRVVTICTPATILQDLRGGGTPEARLLGHVGRLDLLDPRRNGYAVSA